ncbi:MAG TPA: response regulator transcription factor [Candidatus Gastranaerophilales bacterium]|nr:response regulator transcription factor [Candidatus Gastranaerophilales bacterium]
MSFIAKILLVDDNPKYLKDVLPSYGYEVIVAFDGLNALNILKNDENENKFDLILLDVIMPNLNGWDTLKAIRSDKSIESIPIIMLTALDEDHQQVSGLKFGADDYIVKPFTLPNLLARIEALLRRSKWKTERTVNTKISITSSDPINELTTREKEVLSFVAKGASNQEIAEKLYVREVTVKTHLNNIFKKLNVTNRTQAVLLAMQLTII